MDLLCSPPRQPRSEGEGSGQRSFETGGRFLHRHPLFALFDFLKLSFDFYVVVVVEKEQSRKNLKCLTPTIQFQCDTCVKNFKALNFAPFIFPKWKASILVFNLKAQTVTSWQIIFINLANKLVHDQWQIFTSTLSNLQNDPNQFKNPVDFVLLLQFDSWLQGFWSWSKTVRKFQLKILRIELKKSFLILLTLKWLENV